MLFESSNIYVLIMKLSFRFIMKLLKRGIPLNISFINIWNLPFTKSSRTFNEVIVLQEIFIYKCIAFEINSNSC